MLARVLCLVKQVDMLAGVLCLERKVPAGRIELLRL